MINSQVLADMFEVIAESESVELSPFGNVLITGATGMLGGYIAESLTALKSEGFLSVANIYLTVRNNSVMMEELLRLFGDNVNFVLLSDLSEFLHQTEINTYIHAASPSSYNSASSDLLGLFEANVLLTSTLLENAKGDIPKFYFLSSGDVYGPNPKFPTTENDFSGFNPANDRNLYGEFKRTAESLMYIHSLRTEGNFVALRVYHTFGPTLRLSDERIFGSVINSIYSNKMFKWQSDGSTVRNFLYSKDLVTAILRTANLRGFNSFNVAGSESISMREFVNRARYLTDSNLFPEPPFTPSNVGTHIKTGNADTTKLRRLGWQPTIDISEALIRTLKGVEQRFSPVSDC